MWIESVTTHDKAGTGTSEALQLCVKRGRDAMNDAEELLRSAPA